MEDKKVLTDDELESTSGRHAGESGILNPDRKNSLLPDKTGREIFTNYLDLANKCKTLKK